MNEHLDDLHGLPITSCGAYDPDAGASWGASAGCAHHASAGHECLPGARESTEARSGDEALSGDVVERVRVGPYTADVQLERREGGLWIACAMISTETGVLSWCGAATEQEVAQHLAQRRRRSGATAGGFDFGSFLNDLGSQISRGAQQLARNRTLRRVVRDISTTLNRPELQPVLAVAQQIPYLGQALGAVRAAATMADRVLGGNPQARGRLQSIRRAAQGGNAIARQALEVLNDVLRAQQSSAQQRAGSGEPERAPAPRRGRRPRRRPMRRPRRPQRAGAPRRRPASRRPPRRPASPQRSSSRDSGGDRSRRSQHPPRRPASRRRSSSRDSEDRTRRPASRRRRSSQDGGGHRSRPSQHPPRRRAPQSRPPRRRPSRGRPLHRVSGEAVEERAWQEASELWAEHAHEANASIVTPPPAR